MSVDDLREQLKQRGYLSHGIERWFALDPWRSRTFWVQLTVVSAKAALLIGAFAMLPLVTIMLFRNHPLGAWETLGMALCYATTAFVAAFVLLEVIALILKLRPALAIDTPRTLLGIGFAGAALFTLIIGVWWYRFDAPPSLAELVCGLALIVLFFLISSVAISAALLSFSIYELQRVPSIHQRSRGVPMTVAAAILTALLFLPAYAAQERQPPEPPIQVVTIPTAHRVAFIAADGLTFEILHARPDIAGVFGTIAPVVPIPGDSTAERWASAGTGVPARLHGVHSVEGVHFRGGARVVQTLSHDDPVLRLVAVALGMAQREPLPPTVRRRDFVWEIFAARGVPSLAVDWWASGDSRSGGLQSIGQASIFTAAHGNPVDVDRGATQRTFAAVDRMHPQFFTVYLPALDIILNRLTLDRSTQLADSVGALDGIRDAVDGARRRGYDVILLGMPGDRQSGRAVIASTVPFTMRASSAWDVAPTLCTLMGFPLSEEMPGRSLVPAALPRISAYGRRESGAGNRKVNEEYYRNLKSLGYVR